MTRACLFLCAMAACSGGKTADSGATTASGTAPTGTATATGPTSGTAGTGTTAGTSTGTGTPNPGAQQCAQAAANPGTLNGVQTPYDGMVIFCHRDQGGNWHLLNYPVDDCLPHIGHANDLFPTSICDS